MRFRRVAALACRLLCRMPRMLPVLVSRDMSSLPAAESTSHALELLPSDQNPRPPSFRSPCSAANQLCLLPCPSSLARTAPTLHRPSFSPCSAGNQPRVLPAVVRYLSDAGYKFEGEEGNPGIINVAIGC